MGLLIAAICFLATVYIFWMIRSMDRNPNIPGPVSHVILPAIGLPVVGLLIIIGMLALAYSFGWFG